MSDIRLISEKVKAESIFVEEVLAEIGKVIVGQKQSDIPQGATFIGDKGKIFVTRGTIKTEPADLVDTKFAADALRLYASKDHHQNFLDCIASREKPICDVEIGHRSATVCHLGNIALRLGRKISWDPVKETFPGDDEASAMLLRPYRAPWKLG